LSTDTLRLSDKVLLALIGLLSYFALSGTLAPMGLLIEPLAREFEMTASEAARVLSGFTSGNLLGALLALFILEKVPYRLLVLSLYGSAGCVLALLPFSHQTSTIWALLALLGVAFGIGLATAAQLIALIYRDDQRAALLVATDSSFSLAGTVMASLTVFLLIRPIAGLPLWLSPYIAIFCVALLIMLLALIVRYPQGSSSPGDWGWIKRTPKPIWGAAGALYCYTLGQTSILLWLPSLLQSSASGVSLGGDVIGRYWFGMFMGQLLAMALVLVFGRTWVLRVGALGAATGALAVAVSGGDLIMWASLGWGLFNLGILKMLISLAADCAEELPDQLVPALLLMATLGTASSPLATSWLVEVFNESAAVAFGVGAMFCMLVLTFFADRMKAD